MPFDDKDPRSTLSQSSRSSNKQTVEEYAGMEYVRFYEIEAGEKSDNLKNWFARGQNFILSYSEVEPGATLTRDNQPDEYVLLMPDSIMESEIITNNEKKEISGYSITMIPPGKSEIKIHTKGRLVRLFSVKSEDLVEKCYNAKSYTTPHPNITPLEPWPAPADGFKIRSYSLDVPLEKGRFGRIWRCSTFMVNFLDPAVGPRDRKKMSPHSHDDFEQCSLTLFGAYNHHIRWPWGPNIDVWREDEHEVCGTPSIAVIPPPAIHTSASTDPGVNQLVDIFCPPRMDFSEKEGWVLNDKDYPMP